MFMERNRTFSLFVFAFNSLYVHFIFFRITVQWKLSALFISFSVVLSLESRVSVKECSGVSRISTQTIDFRILDGLLALQRLCKPAGTRRYQAPDLLVRSDAQETWQLYACNEAGILLRPPQGWHQTSV